MSNPRPRRRAPRRAALLIPLALAPLALAGGARALELADLDVFNVFGAREPPPAPSPTASPYALSFEVTGGDAAVESSLRDAASLERLRRDAPPDGRALAARAAADLDRLVDALWAEGYYNATVDVLVAGRSVRVGGEGREAAGAAADALRGRAVVPVVVRAAPGPRFTLREVRALGPDGAPLPPGVLPPGALGLAPGDPARASLLRAARARAVDRLREASRPLARAVSTDPVVDHAALTMDVTFRLDPGPVAPFGEVAVSGTRDVPESVVRSFVYLTPGEPYAPDRVADTRRSVATIPAIGAVRVREAKALDASGRLPVFVEVTERKRHLVGFAAAVSTVDGPSARAYYEDRNLMGGAERLRLEAALFQAPRNDGTRLKSIRDFEVGDIGGRLKASLLVPALGGTRNDLLLDAAVERERTGGTRFGGYTARRAVAEGAIRHRFSEDTSVQAGLAFEGGQTADALGQVTHAMVGLPLSGRFDTTDDALNPTRGVRLTASATPWLALGAPGERSGAARDREGTSFAEGRASASTYLALDPEGRTVLAARIGLGALGGGKIEEIPANHRFFAGGGGSVRGYRFRSLGPRVLLGSLGVPEPFAGLRQQVGGRGLIEGQFEARVKVTETIGVVPFVDLGNAFARSLPTASDRLRVAAGLGVRYFSPIGPIRADLAVPLDRQKGERPAALYVSLGQAF